MRCLVLGWLLGVSTIFCRAQPGDATFQLILIGGEGGVESKDSLQRVLQHLPPSTLPSAVIYLGDNLNPMGLPGPEDKARKNDEHILVNQISMASGFGDIYFMAGNHDWKNGRHEGLHYRNNQQRFLDSIRHPKVHFLPRDGCPGPEEIHLSEDLVLVILDTQWFLHPWDKPAGGKESLRFKDGRRCHDSPG